MSYVIRRMKEKDVPAIMEIESVSFGTHHWSAESFINEIHNMSGNYYVLIDKQTNKLLAYGGFWLILDEAHVTTIAVHPDCRGKKLGEVMLQCIVDHCYMKKAKWITLEVRIGNLSAQNLYYKYKFFSMGVRKKYYQDSDEDALIMWTEEISSPDFKSNYDQLKKLLQQKINKTVVYS